MSINSPGELTLKLTMKAECIFFTMDDNVLDKIDEYDEANNQDNTELSSIDVSSSMIGERPPTASGQQTELFLRDSFSPEDHFNKLNPHERPMTTANRLQRAVSQGKIHGRPMHPVLFQNTERAPAVAAHRLSPIKNFPPSSNSYSSDDIEGQVITVHFLSSWGDAYYVGLTGIEVLGKDMRPIHLTKDMLSADPRDMNAIPGHKGDYRTLDKLIDGVNITTDDRHMWLIPLTLSSNPYLRVDLGKRYVIRGIKFYNYNKSLDDSFRGCKIVRISVDDRLISAEEGHMIRKAPGTKDFDFGHTLELSMEAGVRTARLGWSIFQNNIQDAIQRAKNSGVGTPRQDYETILLPTAYVFKFQFNCTFGDMYYIGLNGLELYDAQNRSIPLTLDHLKAVPGSISDEIPDGRGDPRTLDKLIDGVVDVHDGTHSWLAPFIPGQPNYLYIIFEEPVAISMIKIWNYSKTQLRGVQEMEVHADDILIYKGFLRQARSDGHEYAQSILFTNDSQVYEREKRNIYTHGNQELDILLWNNGQGTVMSRPQQSGSSRPSVQQRHPSTSRPHTSLVPRT